MRKLHIFGLIALAGLIIGLAWAEEITLSTYYPAPYGVYREMRLHPNSSPSTCDANNEGAIYYNDATNQLMVCGETGPATYAWASAGGYWAASNDDIYNTNIANVGIGTMTPGSTLTVAGTTWCNSGVWDGSDIRWKKNVETLANPLEKVLKLRGISFDWKREEFEGSNFPEGRQIGIIAQELEKEFPELVTTDGDGYKAIAYDRLTAVLLEAIKAQQEEIKGLKQEISKIKEDL